MSENLTAIALACGVAAVVLGLIAIARAANARRESEALRDEVRRLSLAVTELRDLLEKQGARPSHPMRKLQEGATTPVPGAAPLPSQATAVPAPNASAESAAQGAAAPPAEAEAPRWSGPTGEPEPPREAVPPTEESSLEERIGVHWFTRIGAAVLLLGAAYFFKYTVDNDWISAEGRLIAGALVGAGMLTAAERIRATARAGYGQALLGAGVGVLYLTAYAAYALYHLVPPPLAFALLAGVSLLAGALSLRHGSEVTLVIALLAALANPILLSTGEDRPVALFGYTLLVSAGALAVAFARRFSVAPWLVFAGALLLTGAWHARHFDPRGTYADPAARAVPLAFVFALGSGLVAFGRAAGQRAWTSVSPGALAGTGLLALPIGCAALLYDRPVLLLFALTLASLLTLALQPGETGAALPSLIVAGTAAVALGRGRGESHATMLAAAAMWSFAWAGVIAARRSTAESAGLAAVLASMAMALAARLMLRRNPEAVAAVAVALSAGTALLGAKTERRGVVTLGAVVSLGVLVLCGMRAHPEAGVVLALAGVWAAVHIAEATHHLLTTRNEASAGASVLAGFVSLGFVGAVLVGSAEHRGLLRAVAALLAGGALIGAGLLVRARRPAARNAADVMLGAGALTLVLGANLGARGPMLTLLLGVLGVAAAFGASRAGDARWMRGAVLLLVGATVHGAWFDGRAPGLARELFEATLGRRGEAYTAFLRSDRSLGWASAGVALLAAAYAFARGTLGERGKRMATIATVVGYGLLIGVCVTEVRGALAEHPALRGAGDPDAFARYIELADRLAREQSNRLAVSTTLTLGVCAAILMVIGFAARSVLHRGIGLLVLALTLLKLAAWDVWNLPRLHQVFVLLGVGALLLGVGFLYARLGSRILRILKA